MLAIRFRIYLREKPHEVDSFGLLSLLYTLNIPRLLRHANESPKISPPFSPHKFREAPEPPQLLLGGSVLPYMKNALLILVAVILLAPALVVQAKQGGNATSKTFKVATETKILSADSKAAALGGLKVGDKVGLVYKEADGALTLSSIHVMPDAKGEKGANKADHKAAKAEGALYAKGVITAIDETAGTITVDVKEHTKKS